MAHSRASQRTGSTPLLVTSTTQAAPPQHTPNDPQHTRSGGGVTVHPPLHRGDLSIILARRAAQKRPEDEYLQGR
ncbi:hypothetical protein E2C01_070973 [Portunus trituberculatus]|uniref:Uncharacterized protein n=1 Tax=Portunus trituberculatus TaxID=210409 RepID=A0A5B7I512_PORTR|nr:hypothetical protein [Portunus trituberculatus]